MYRWLRHYNEVMAVDCRHTFGTPKDCFGQQLGKVVSVTLMRRHNIGATYIHECLHFLYPKWPHKEVFKWEGIIWGKLKWRRRLRIYRKMFST